MSTKSDQSERTARLVPDASDTRPIAKREEKANVEGEVLAFEPKHVNVLLLAYRARTTRKFLSRFKTGLFIETFKISKS